MSAQKIILVTGASGQVGSELAVLAPAYPNFQFIFANRDLLALDDAASVHHFFDTHTIFACINCAAYTAVDKAESEKELALQVNAVAPGLLAAACKKQGAWFIHFSTDYVFAGNADKPYTTNDATSPVNFYGSTKLQGEQAALQANPDSIIIRTSWVYSSFGKNFVKTMLRLMQEQEQVGVVADQWGCPTYAADLARAVLQIVQHPHPGIYHYCNEGIISWHQLATAIKEITGSTCTVNAIATSDYPTPASRPAYSALDTQKIKTQFGLHIPFWKDSLKNCLQLLQ